MHANTQADLTVSDEIFEREPRAPELYSLCEFEIDLSQGVLRRSGIEIELAPKSFSVLAYLIRNRGRLVSRKELLHHVWPSVLVGKGSLTQAIWEVRRALADCRAKPRFIHTQYRRGYRFVGGAAPDPSARDLSQAGP